MDDPKLERTMLPNQLNSQKALKTSKLYPSNQFLKVTSAIKLFFVIK